MSALNDAVDFYNKLSSRYHLVYPDWKATITAQAEILSRLIRATIGGAGRRLFDCACGIGTQAIGLASNGYDVTAMDISRRAVARARREARKWDLRTIQFTVGDMRRMPDGLAKTFDVVICCDNPLAHMLEVQELKNSIQGMYSSLREGGLLLLSSRDYESAVVERPTCSPVRHRLVQNRETIVFQLWDWEEDEPIYNNMHFIIQKGRYGWKTHQTAGRMRAYTQSEISAAVREAGFEKIDWKNPDQSGYFQPVLMAVRPNR